MILATRCASKYRNFRRLDDLLNLGSGLLSCQWNIGHRSLSPSSSVLCCRLHLPPPAVPETCCPHSFLQISFPRVLWSSFTSMVLPCPLYSAACLAKFSSVPFSVRENVCNKAKKCKKSSFFGF